MNYSRARGQRQHIYEPKSWTEEQEELKLIKSPQQEREARKPPGAAPQPITPTPQART